MMKEVIFWPTREAPGVWTPLPSGSSGAPLFTTWEFWNGPHFGPTVGATVVVKGSVCVCVKNGFHGWMRSNTKFQRCARPLKVVPQLPDCLALPLDVIF
jgi:hypothetical protein